MPAPDPPRRGATRGVRTRGLLAGVLLAGAVAGPACPGTTPAAAQAARVAPGTGGPSRYAAAPSDRLRVLVFPGRRELIIELGPVDLPARSSHGEIRQLPIQRGTVPFDLAVSGYRAEIVDGRGEPVPQDVLHHLNLLDPGRRELFLPIMRRLLAASRETKPQSLPGWLFGMPLEAGDPFLALTMLHNPTARAYEDVRVRLVMEYVRADRLPLYRIYPFHLDVMFPVGSKAFDLPPGRTVRSFEGRPAVAGGILGLGGHLHRYATRLRLEDATTGEVLYEVEPVTGEDGRVEAVPAHRYRGRGIGKLIHPSHRYRVTVVYDNPTGRTIPDGGMGSVAGAFLPLVPWPAADPADELYRADYRAVTEDPAHDGHAHEDEASDGSGGD